MIIIIFAVFFLSYTIVAKLKPIEHTLEQNGAIVKVGRNRKRQWALAYAIWLPGVAMVVAGVTLQVPYLPSIPSQVVTLAIVTFFMGAFLAYMPVILSPDIVLDSNAKTIKLNKTTYNFSEILGMRFYDARARLTTMRNGYVLCLILANGKEQKLVTSRNATEVKLLNKIFHQLLKVRTQAVLPGGFAKTKNEEVDYVQ